MSKFKLIYLNFIGRGEAIRFLLSYGGIDFEDVRIEMADWPKLKHTMPYGKVPVLEIDGVKHSHSMAICSYLGDKFGLSGTEESERMQIRQNAYFIFDVINMIDDVLYNYKDSFADHQAQIQKFINETVPMHLGRFDAIVAKNNGYFVNGKLSWADILFASICTYFQEMFDWLGIKEDGNFVEKYENLKNLRDKVLNIESIKKWIDRRPKPVQQVVF